MAGVSANRAHAPRGPGRPGSARRGRPIDPAKRAALLAAARRLFLAKGYEGVTMGEIAQRARVSKATLYARFVDRSALLEAVIRTESARVLGDRELIEEAGLDLQTRLKRLGLRLLSFLTDPERLQFERLLAGAAERYPDLAARCFEAGPGRARATLIRLIRTGVAQGRLRVADAFAAAGDLVGLWQGFLRIETTLRYRQVGRAELRRHAARGVRLFLRLYGADDAGTRRPRPRSRT
ncbi:MAG TPA: TetR/AcrR family transcriptional regulator [Steroidobacteraceae bacterium]|nr:TetR/AcrR family transcriptional regulator [Steroidobacteraceae bacterium]